MIKKIKIMKLYKEQLNQKNNIIIYNKNNKINIQIMNLIFKIIIKMHIFQM